MSVGHFVSVVCPVYQERAHIAACLDALLAQTYPSERIEFLLVDGGSTDGTREVVQGYVAKDNRIRLLENPHRTVPYALNIGIRASRGDTIVRVDAHSTYPDDYVLRLVNELYRLKADNVGGVWKTLPGDTTAQAYAVAYVTSSAIGVGNSAHKTGELHIQQVDTVPYGCFPRALFDRIGYFDEEMTRNQDDELNGRITQAGGKIYIIPDVEIGYRARPTIVKMAKMYYQYGLFKPLGNSKLKRPTTWRQFVPMLFVAGLVVGSILSAFIPFFWGFYLCVLGLYLLVLLVDAMRYALRTCKFKAAILIPYAYASLHFSYGTGYWVGLCKLLTGGSFDVNISR